MRCTFVSRNGVNALLRILGVSRLNAPGKCRRYELQMIPDEQPNAVSNTVPNAASNVLSQPSRLQTCDYPMKSRMALGLYDRH